MAEKFNLKRMLEEIREDQAVKESKHRKLTQEDVKRRVATKHRTGSPTGRER